MQRRDFVKAMVAATVTAKEAMSQQAPASAAPSTPTPATPASQTLPAATPRAPGPVPWTHGLMDAKPLPITPLVADAVAQAELRFFSEKQLATLRRLSLLLMPATKKYPGAIEAGVPEFLDFLLGISPPERQQMYLSGLDRLELEAKHRFSASFASLKAPQADELIRPWLQAWMGEHPPTEMHARFINLAHSDIRMATINSQAWSEAAQQDGKPTPDVDLYWYPIDPDLHHDGLAHTRGKSVLN